jgi:filamentous hemagglutinin family protein
MLRAWLLGTTALLPAATAALAQGGVAPNALPTGGQVVAGQAAISQSGAAMQVRQGSDRAAINWQGFSVGANASVNFQQPSATSWTLNRVTGPDPSVIAGRITANGGVAIVNQSGMVFAQGAQVNVGSLIASAANVTNENFMAGRMVFDGAPKPGARVENHGSITVADRGLAALVGPRVGNSGTIRARLGRVALAGAETYSLDLAGDGLLSIDVTQAVRKAEGGATALVTNSGVIEAQGGAVLITAHAASGLVEDLVRNTGRVSADAAAGRAGQVALRAEGGGVRVEGQVTARGGAASQGGRVEMRGSTATTVAGTARIDASGGAGGGTVLVGTSGVGRNQAMSARTTVEAGARLRADARRQGQGGTIAVNSTTATVARGSFSARGGTEGGDGGLVELSGQGALQLQAQVDLAAPRGRSGTLLLDPDSISVVTALPGTLGEGDATVAAPGTTVTANTGPGGITFVTAASLSALDGAGVTVQLEAKQNIAINAALALSNSTLNLFADAITQSATGTITADKLVIRGFAGTTTAAGSAMLEAANSVRTLDALVSGVLTFNNTSPNLAVLAATGSSVTLRTTGNLSVAGNVGGAGVAVALNVDGAISQTAGTTIAAATLTVAGANNAGAASVALTGSNAVQSLDAQSAGDLGFTNGAAVLAVARATTSGPNATVTLSGGGRLTLEGAVGSTSTAALDATGATVNLATPDGVGQSPGSAIAARSLSVTSAGGGIDLSQTGNEIGRLAATAGGAGNGVVVTSARAMSVLAGGITAGDGSTIGLSAPDLDIDGALGFAPGSLANRINLTADTLGATAAINAGSNGLVSIATRRAGRDIGIGGPASDALSISTATLNRVTAGRLDISAGGALTVGTSLATAPVISLAAGGDITQKAGSTITATSLAVTSTGGKIDLSRTNAVATLDASAKGALSFENGSALAVTRASGSAVTLRTAGALTLNGAVGRADGTVDLNVGGAITQAGGAVSATTLTIRGAGAGASRAGSASLGQENAVGGLDARVTNGLLIDNGANTLAVTEASGATVTLTTKGSLALEGGVGGSGAAVALNVTGAVTQTSGTIEAASLTIRGGTGTAGSAATSIALGQDNDVVQLEARATGALSFSNGNSDLAVTRAVGSAVTLTTRQALDLQGTVGQADGTVALNVTKAITQSAGLVAADRLTVRDATGGDGTGAASLALGRTNSVARLDAKTAGALSLDNGTADLAVTRAVGGTVTLTTTKALQLDGPVGQGNAAVALHVGGAITQTTGAVTAATLTIRGATGGTTRAASAALGQANAVERLDARVTNDLLLNNGTTGLILAEGLGNAVTLRGSGTLSLQGDLGGAGNAAVTLRIGGATSQSAGVVTTSALTIRGEDGTSAAGAVTLGRANAIGTLDAFSNGDIAVTATGAPLGVARAEVTGTGKAVSLADAAGLGLTGTVGGTDAAVTLAAAAGGIAQSSGALTAASVTATAGLGGIALGATGNRIAGVSAASGGDVGVTSGTSMTVLAGGITAAAGASIALAAPTLTIGEPVGFAGPSADNSITLAANALSATAPVNAGAEGLVRITPFSVSRALTIGTGALEQATLDQVTAGRLILAASGTGALALNGNLTLAKVPVLELIAAGGISQAEMAVLTVGMLSATSTSGSISLVGQNRIGRITGRRDDPMLGLVAGGDVTIANAQAIRTEAALVAGTGHSITLRADDLALGAELRAASGSLGAINLVPRTDGRPVLLGAGDPAALSVDATQLQWLRAGAAGTLRIGGNDIEKPVAGSVSIGGAVGLRGGFNQGLAGTLDLQGRSIGQSAALDVATLAAVASGGDVTLMRAGNAIDALGRVSATEGVVSIASASLGGLTLGGPLDARAATLTAAAGLTLFGNVTLSGDLVLRSDGAIGQGGGRISAGGVLAAGADAATAASVQLLAAGNDVGSFAARATGLVGVSSTAGGAGGTFTIGRVQGVAGIEAGRLVAGSSGRLAVAQALTLTDAGTDGSQLTGRLGLGLAANVTAAGDVLLRSDAAIEQTAGPIRASGIAARGADGARTGSVRLLQDGNAIGRFAAAASGAVEAGSSGTAPDVTFTIGTVQGVSGITANGVRVVAGGTLAVAQPIRASDTVTLQADRMAVGAVIGASGDSLGAINLLPLTAGRRVVLGGADDPARLSLTTAAFPFLQPGGNGTLRIGSDGGTPTAGSLVVAGDVTVAGSNAVLDLRAHDVSQTGGVLTVAALTGAAQAGFVLDAAISGAAVNRIGALGVAAGRVGSAIGTAAGDIRILSALGLTVRGTVTADSVTLRGEGLVIGESPARPVLVQAAGGSVTLDGGAGGFDLTRGSTVRAVAGAEGGDVAISAGAGASIHGLLDTGAAGGRDVTIAAGAPVLDGIGIRAARDVKITSSGSYSVATDVTAGRDALLSADLILGVNSGGSVSAGRDAVLTGAGSSSIDGAITGGRSVRVVSTGGDIAIGAVSIAAGSGTLSDATAELRLSAGGGITNDGRLTSAGRAIALVSTGGSVLNRSIIDSSDGGGAAGAIRLEASAPGTIVTNAAGARITGGSVVLAGQAQVVQDSRVSGTEITLSAGSGAPLNGILVGSGSITTASSLLTLIAASGNIAATGAMLKASGAMSIEAQAGAVRLTGSDVNGVTTVTVRAGAGDIVQDGGLLSARNSLSLTAGGNVTQASGGRIVTPVLSGSADGNVALLNGVALPARLAATGMGNAIDEVAGFTAGGDFALASTAARLGISKAVSAGAGRELRLFAEDFALTAALQAPGGTVSLSPYTRDGSVALVLGGPSGASAVNAVTLDSAELDLLPANAAARLRLGRLDTPDGRSDFGAIGIAGRVDLVDPATGADAKVGRLELQARGGIAQQAGTRLAALGLAATAGGDILLDPGTGANRIGGLAGVVTPGNFVLRNGFGGTMAVAAGSAVAGDAGQGADGIRVGDGKTVTLRGDDFAIAGAVRAPSGTIEILPETQGRAVALGGGGADAFGLDGGELALIGGGLPLDAGAATLLRIGGAAGLALPTAGAITLGGPVGLQGAVARVQALELLSAGSIQGSGGAITVPALRAAAAGEARLDHAGNSFLVNAVSGTDVAIRQAGDLRLANAVAAIGGVDAPGGVTATGRLALVAGGTITQDAGAVIRAGTLTLASGGAVTLGEANRFGTLAAASIGGAAATSLVRGTGYAVAGPVTAAGSLRLVAAESGSLAVTGSIAAAGALELATGQGAGPGAAPFGRISVSGSIAAGTDIALGTAVGPVLLTGATLTAGGGITLATGGTGLEILGSTVRAGGALTISAGVSGQGGAVGVTGSSLTAAGTLAIGASHGDLGMDGSTVAAGGGLTLTALDGAISQRRGSLGGATLALRAGRGITLVDDGGASPVLAATAGALTLTTGAGDIRIAGTVLNAAAELGLEASAGAIGIGRSSVTAGGAAALRAATALNLTDVAVQAGGDIAAIAGTGDVTLLRAGLAAGGGLSMAATGGSLGLDAVTGAASGAVAMMAGRLIDIAGSSVTAGLGQSISAQGSFGATGSTVTAQGADLDIVVAGRLSLDGSSLTAGKALTVNAGRIDQRRGSLTGAGITAQAAGGIAVAADGGDAPRLTATNGSLGLSTSAGDLALSGAVLLAATHLSLNAAGGAIAATGLTAAAGAVSVDAGSAIVFGRSALSAERDLAVAAGGDLGLASSTLLAGAGARMTAGGLLTATGASLAAGTDLAVTSRLASSFTDTAMTAGGALAVTSTAAGIGQTRGSLTGGEVRLRAAGELLVADGGSGPPPALRSTAGALSLRAGSVALRQATGSGATGLDLAAGGGISLANTALATPGLLTAAARSLSVLGSSLTSTAGDIDLTAGGAGAIVTSTLRAARQVRVVTGGGLALTFLSLDADAADFEAGRPNPAAYGGTDGGSAMTTSGVTARIGTALLLAAPGGVTGPGPTLVTPRGAALPAVLFDTRLAPERNPLTIVQPDIAGVEAGQQPTQVRSAPGSQGPGAFGLPNQTTAAGPVALNLNAGQSAVFLLVDGGSVSGSVTAGRLAVHGAGGGSTLAGTLGGSAGAEAARFADITRPIDAGALQRYRFNSCVIGSINCVVPPSIQILPLRPTDQARFTIENNRINLSDVLIPNVGEEDNQ